MASLPQLVLLLIVWIILAIDVIHKRFFNRFAFLYNAIVLIVLAALLLGVSRVLPKSKEQPTIRQMADAVVTSLKQQVPWLSEKPPSPPAPRKERPRPTTAVLPLTKELFAKEGTTLTFKHNLSTRSPHIECYNSQGDMFEVGSIHVVNSNTVVISMAVPMEGRCSASK